MANGHKVESLAQEMASKPSNDIRASDWRDLGYFVERFLKEYVNWKIFVWAMGLIVIVLGWQFVRLDRVIGKVDMIQEQTADVRTDVASIKTAVEFIAKELDATR